MYLTGGQFKGQKIEVPKNVKPTLSKVRESVFNILSQYEFKNNTFLDMFSGSAIIGLEALSRGYRVKELEINPKTAKIIKSNYEKLKLKADLTICNSLNYKTQEKYDIVYLDPPWEMDYKNIIKKAYELVSSNGIIIVEFDTTKNINIKEILNEINLDLEIIKDKKYARVGLIFLKAKAQFSSDKTS